jgi:hypothetical protein
MLIFLAELSQNDVQLQLHQEEAAELSRDNQCMLHSEITPFVFIIMGLDLELQQ